MLICSVELPHFMCFNVLGNRYRVANICFLKSLNLSVKMNMNVGLFRPVSKLLSSVNQAKVPTTRVGTLGSCLPLHNSESVTKLTYFSVQHPLQRVRFTILLCDDIQLSISAAERYSVLPCSQL